MVTFVLFLLCICCRDRNGKAIKYERNCFFRSAVGRANLSKSGPNDPNFFSWVWVHALMAVRTLTLSLVKYLRDAVDFCETAQMPLWSLSAEKLWVSNFVLQSLIDPKPCPFFSGHTLWATFRVIHALHILPWSHFPRPLTNRSRQSRF